MKILIIDDHAVLREAVAVMLERLIPEAVVSTAEHVAIGLQMQSEAGGYDLLLLDLLMPNVLGLEALRLFRTSFPTLPIVILSASLDPPHVREALAAGASGYVPKSAGSQTLANVVALVIDGDIYVPPMLLSDAEPDSPVHTQPRKPDDCGLTARQVEVLRLLAQGLSNKEIGLNLALSEKTVKVHVSAIYRRLGVTRRMAAAERARLLQTV